MFGRKFLTVLSMKILYLITKSNWGGAQRYVFDLAVAMRDAGNDVVVAAGGNGRLFEKLAAENIRTHSIKDVARDIGPMKDLRALSQVRKLIRQEKPDIIHVNSSKMGLLGALAGRRAPGKVVFTAHGWPFKEDRGFLWRSMAKFFSWMTLRNADITIVPSDDDLLLGQKMLGAGDKVVHIANGRELKDLLPREEARRILQNNLGLDPDKQWIVAFSELHPNKGVQFLIQAMQKTEAQAVVFGEGEARADLESQIKTAHVGDKVFLPGFMPDASQYALAFDIFCMPSIKEGLPYAVIEASLAGLPVVASRVGGIPEVVHTAGILVPPKDPEALERAFVLLMSDDEYRARLGVAAKARAQTLFSRERMVRETSDLYSRTLSV